MKRLIRRAVAVAAFAAVVFVPKASAQYENCYRCKGIVYEDGTQSMYCSTPPPLVYGSEYCEIGEIDVDRWYCQTWGDSCCNDPL